MNKDSTIKLLTGNHIPILGLGSWQLTHDTSDTISYALKIGYRMIDTSSDYGSQRGIGEAIKMSGIERKDIYIITKVEEDDDAYERTKSNLQELQMEYVDLMLIHRPPDSGAGTPLWEGLIKAKQEGLTKDIGVSNYPINLIDQLIEETQEVPVVNEIEWSPFGHSQQMLEYCQHKQIAIIAYSPITRGTRLDDPTLKQLADKYSKSPAQIIIRWDLQTGVIPIIKANQKKHLDENINVFDFELSQEDIKLLNSLNEGYSSLGGLPYI